MILPWQRAKRAFEAVCSRGTFEELLGRYVAEGGYVWSSPEEFLLAIPCRRLHRGGLVTDHEKPDVWFVHLAAVSPPRRMSASLIARFQSLAPRPLPWVAWNRRGGSLRFYRWDQLAAHAAQPQN